MLVLWKNAEKGARLWLECAALVTNDLGGLGVCVFAGHGLQMCSRLTYLDSLLQ
jgi:hypothetical protein